MGNILDNQALGLFIEYVIPLLTKSPDGRQAVFLLKQPVVSPSLVVAANGIWMRNVVKT